MSEYFSAENLVKNFDSVKIDVSFACEKETITSIVGPSGSGKSTILKLIAGLEKCDESEKKARIILDGNEISNLPPAKREIGMVFQNHALFSHLRVDDNVLCQKESKKRTRERWLRTF